MFCLTARISVTALSHERHQVIYQYDTRELIERLFHIIRMGVFMVIMPRSLAFAIWCHAHFLRANTHWSKFLTARISVTAISLERHQQVDDRIRLRYIGIPICSHNPIAAHIQQAIILRSPTPSTMTRSSRVSALTALIAIIVHLFAALKATEAYSSPAKRSATASITSTSLNAWTLPNNNNLTSRNPFGKFSATWYDDHNPTARKVVYNDE